MQTRYKRHWRLSLAKEVRYARRCGDAGSAAATRRMGAASMLGIGFTPMSARRASVQAGAVIASFPKSLRVACPVIRAPAQKCTAKLPLTGPTGGPEAVCLQLANSGRLA